MTSPSDVARLRQIQAQLEDLSSLVETHPRRVLGAMPTLLQELQHWPQRDAYLWCLHLSAQAFRFTDELDSAVSTAMLALDGADPNSEFAAGLHLEAGMALNQKGSQTDAEPHLRAAASIYEQLEDPDGQAWALVALAESLCGLALVWPGKRRRSSSSPTVRLRLEWSAINERSCEHSSNGRSCNVSEGTSPTL